MRPSGGFERIRTTMTEGALSYLTPEAKARVEIDAKLERAGWQVQHANQVNPAAAPGVAVREVVLKPPHWRVDYLLFVDRKAVGVIEAKKEGETLTGVEWQSAKYLDGLPNWIQSAIDSRHFRSGGSRSTPFRAKADRWRRCGEACPDLKAGPRRDDCLRVTTGALATRRRGDRGVAAGTRGLTSGE
jgi:hypothetical protein